VLQKNPKFETPTLLFITRHARTSRQYSPTFNDTQIYVPKHRLSAISVVKLFTILGIFSTLLRKRYDKLAHRQHLCIEIVAKTAIDRQDYYKNERKFVTCTHKYINIVFQTNKCSNTLVSVTLMSAIDLNDNVNSVVSGVILCELITTDVITIH